MIRSVSDTYSIFWKIPTYANIFYFNIRISSSLCWIVMYLWCSSMLIGHWCCSLFTLMLRRRYHHCWRCYSAAMSPVWTHTCARRPLSGYWLWSASVHATMKYRLTSWTYRTPSSHCWVTKTVSPARTVLGFVLFNELQRGTIGDL